MQKLTEQQKAENAAKAEKAAKSLYPNEKWEFLEEGIYIAKSRLPQSAEQMNVLEKELQQARILVSRGSTVYLLPEKEHPIILNKKYPDSVVDGNVMELKAITGGKRMIIKRYKQAKDKKVNYVFMFIESNFTPDYVKYLLSNYIKKKGFTGGFIFVYFLNTKEFLQWTEDELAAIKNDKKNRPNT